PRRASDLTGQDAWRSAAEPTWRHERNAMMADGIAAKSGATLDVAKFLHDLPFTRFHIQLLVICSLVTFFDGLDFSLIAYTLPYLREGMDLSDAMTGYVSSAA